MKNSVKVMRTESHLHKDLLALPISVILRERNSIELSIPNPSCSRNLQATIHCHSQKHSGRCWDDPTDDTDQRNARGHGTASGSDRAQPRWSFAKVRSPVCPLDGGVVNAKDGSIQREMSLLLFKTK